MLNLTFKDMDVEGDNDNDFVTSSDSMLQDSSLEDDYSSLYYPYTMSTNNSSSDFEQVQFNFCDLNFFFKL